MYIKVVEKIKGIKEIKAGPDKTKGGHPRYLAILSAAYPGEYGVLSPPNISNDQPMCLGTTC
jgi:hypothetical protein